MTKAAKTVWIVAIVALLVAFGTYIVWDRVRASSHTINCDDGVHRTIDIRDFTITYSAYSVQLQGAVASKARFSATLGPVALQQLSESLASADEFRKALVAGYNACAVSKAQYGRDIEVYQALDVIARQIDALASKPEPSSGDSAELDKLINQYAQTAGVLSANK